MAASAPAAQTGACFRFWPAAGAALVVIAAGFGIAVLAGIPAVLILGTHGKGGELMSNFIGAAFYLGGAVVLLPLLRRVSGMTLEQLGVRPLRRSDWGYIAGGSVAFLALKVIFSLAMLAFHQPKHVQVGFEHFTVVTPVAALMVLTTGAVIAPICEELFFRALIFNTLAMRMPIFMAAVIGGVLFGAAHADPVLFPILAIFGVMQAVIYRASGSLIVPIVIHALNNFIFLLLMMATQGAS